MNERKSGKMGKYGKIPVIVAGMLIIGGIIFCQFVYGQKKISAEEIKELFPYEEGDLVPVYNLEQDQKLSFDFEMDYHDAEELDYQGHDLVSIHTDASCSEESKITCYVWEMENNGKTRVSVAPVEPVLANDSLDEKDVISFSDNMEAESPADYKTLWGCAPIYYICIHYDTKATKPVKLKNPQIIPFTAASESEVPDLKGMIDNQGNLTLSWDPVEDAQYYTVYQYVSGDAWIGYNNEAVRGGETGYQEGTLWSLTRTEDTDFSDFWGEEAEERDEMEDLYDNAEYIGMPLSHQSFQNRGAYGCFFVTATVDGKESNLSAPVDTADLKLPYKFAYTTINYTRFNSIEELPEKLAVVNIDGSIMQRPVYYRLRKKGDISSLYDFQVKGTLLGGTIYLNMDHVTELPFVINQNINMIYLDMNSQLNKVPSMAVKSIPAQEQTAGGGVNLYRAALKRTEQWVEEGNREKVKVPDAAYAVFADSAEEAWLAYNLMAGNGKISLKAFPKLQNPYTLEEVFLKVCQQNPYVLGVRSYSYDYDQACLRVGYSYDRPEIFRKQKKIYQQAEKLIKELISEKMTDGEKEMQLYLWLEKNCSYASVEWEQAKKQNFLKSEGNVYMENAVNAYGALVDREALCQGYASAFQLLSHMAGLNVKTVSGYLNGNIPHAWNMIKLKGNWYQIDCSSNQNTIGVPFYLYNGDRIFAEENGYVLGNDFLTDEEREVLEAGNRDYSREYYNCHNLTPDSMEEVDEILSEHVHEDIIVFRYTDYDFDEEILIRLVRKNFLLHGEDERLGSLSYSRINEYVVIYDQNP